MLFIQSFKFELSIIPLPPNRGDIQIFTEKPQDSINKISKPLSHEGMHGDHERDHINSNDIFPQDELFSLQSMFTFFSDVLRTVLGGEWGHLLIETSCSER